MAAQYVGCSPSSLARTLDSDPEFAEAVATAEQNVEIEALQRVRNASRNDRYWRRRLGSSKGEMPATLPAARSTRSPPSKPRNSSRSTSLPSSRPCRTTTLNKSMNGSTALYANSTRSRNSRPRYSLAPKLLEKSEPPPPARGNFGTQPSKGLCELCDEESSQGYGEEQVPIVPNDATEAQQ